MLKQSIKQKRNKISEKFKDKIRETDEEKLKIFRRVKTGKSIRGNKMTKCY